MLKDLYLKNSLIPKRYISDIQLKPAQDDLQTFKELAEIRKNITDFVKNGNNLLIYSKNVGNGKTTYATKLLKEYIDQNCNKAFKNDTPVLFVNVTNLLNEKKLAIDNKDIADKVKKIERDILTAKLVVFDDLGVKNISQYDLGNLYYWIDARTSNMQSCIFTSNLIPSKLLEALDARLYSRIVNYSILKEFKDGDNRC